MKKAMLLICGVIFFVGCASKIDPTPGDKCKPKWYKDKKASDSEIVYGHSVEKSRSSSLATSIGLAAAQADALRQINSRIKETTKKAIEEKQIISGGKNDNIDQYISAAYQKLKLELDQPCNYCLKDESEECEDKGYLVVYTRVKINVEDFLNEDLRNKMDKLLEKPDELMKELKEF